MFGLACLTIALTSPEPFAPENILFGCLMGLPVLTGGISLLVFAQRAYVIADKEGLRWRGLGRERRVSWGDITDYYLDSVRRPAPLVDTPHGQINLSLWSNLEQLKAAVAAGALHAKSKSWDVRGIRPEDEWPVAFRYTNNSRAMRVVEKAMLCFLSLYPLGVLLVPLTQFSLTEAVAALETMWRYNGPAATVVIVALLWIPTAFFSLSYRSSGLTRSLGCGVKSSPAPMTNLSQHRTI